MIFAEAIVSRDEEMFPAGQGTSRIWSDYRFGCPHKLKGKGWFSETLFPEREKP